MAIITSSRLINFKRFEDQVIDLSAPITLLLGPNSSGKSSIIKALLGLKQTTTSTNEHEVFATQGDYADLGIYQDYVFNHQLDYAVTLETTIEWGEQEKAPIPLCPEVKTVSCRITYDYDSTTTQARIQKIILFQYKNNSEYILLSIERKKTRNSYRLICGEYLLNMLSVILRDGMPENTKRSWGNGLTVYHTERLAFSSSPSGDTLNTSISGTELPLAMFNAFISKFSQVLDRNIFYLGPLRSSPSRSYTRTSHNIAVGPRGEHTPSVLGNLERRQIKVTRGQSELRTSFDALSRWIEIVFPGKKTVTETFAELVKLRVSSSVNGAGDVISDVGFGFSQVFPILVQAAVMPPGSTLIIEQPELHLHPMAQAGLARVIASAAKMGRRFIIETHSEHFLRGLQLSISEEQLKPGAGITTNYLSVLYIPPSPEPIRHMPVNLWGEFTCDWPSGFFDEAYKLAFALMQNKARGLSEIGDTKQKTQQQENQ